MAHQKFVLEHVFPSPSPVIPGRTIADLVSSSLLLHSDLLCWQTCCFLEHSIFDDLPLMLEESASDLHHDFNLPTVIPMWIAVRGLNFDKLLDYCLSFLDHGKCNVIVWRMTGNDIDSTCSISDLTEQYLVYAHKFIRYCEAKKVIICEALPCTRTRNCSIDSYFNR